MLALEKGSKVDGKMLAWQTCQDAVVCNLQSCANSRGVFTAAELLMRSCHFLLSMEEREGRTRTRFAEFDP